MSERTNKQTNKRMNSSRPAPPHSPLPATAPAAICEQATEPAFGGLSIACPIPALPSPEAVVDDRHQQSTPLPPKRVPASSAKRRAPPVHPPADRYGIRCCSPKKMSWAADGASPSEPAGVAAGWTHPPEPAQSPAAYRWRRR
eukprot:GHVU01138343.1.p1 GENE.GHVU01138343.1~~GHVU01138343.1.p1  ORF type:complete len:143 (+),score=10.54 GHVU01138343.1:50-478(+)